MIGINTIYLYRIANREKERRKFSIRGQYWTNETSYGVVTTTPTGICTSSVLHLCIAITKEQDVWLADLDKSEVVTATDLHTR